jgi:diacylglycerol kinase family enzyme
MAAKISTGEPSTLGTYRKIAAALTGEDSPATKLLDDKIKEQGEDAEVIQHESQMLFLIARMGFGAEPEPVAELPAERLGSLDANESV